jgi:hypothetical protein
MHRIDTEANDDGLFQDGTPQLGQQGTMMDADWANAVQENICEVIEGAGLVLEKGDHEQLKDAISGMISASTANIIAATRLPVGTIIERDGPGQPAGGYCAINTEYLRADHPDLVAWYTAQGRLIAGSTGAHFRTPNYEGLFSRAHATDNAVDPSGDRAAGDVQAHAFASHSHDLPVRSNANTGNGYVEDADNSGSVSTATTATTGGSTETRPINVVTWWWIKD